MTSVKVWIKETNKKALSGGFVEFESAGGDSSNTATAAAGDALGSDSLFGLMAERVGREHVKNVKGVFKFEIKKDGKGVVRNTVKLLNGSQNTYLVLLNSILGNISKLETIAFYSETSLLTWKHD